MTTQFLWGGETRPDLSVFVPRSSKWWKQYADRLGLAADEDDHALPPKTPVDPARAILARRTPPRINFRRSRGGGRRVRPMAVVNKSIGETEKTLDRLLATALSRKAVLKEEATKG